MPELPEVESTVRGLSPLIVGRKIIDVWSDAPKLIKNGTFEGLKKSITGKKILSVSRRAKNILIRLEGDDLLLIHLKMTGHLMVNKWNLPDKKEKPVPLGDGALTEKVNGYIHVIFILDDGRMLALSDLRKFAKVTFGKEQEVIRKEKIDKIGPEATDITLSELKDIFKDSKKGVKMVLLDQDRIAGIGNIYSDDILWKAKVHPLRPVNSLSDKEIKDIHQATRDILSLAISLGGTSISDYRDVSGERGGYGDRRLVYRRDGEPCKRCKTPIKRIKVGSRSARFCPECQKI